jgi:hypothetical protein
MSICVVISNPNGIIIASDSKTKSSNPVVKNKFIGFTIGDKKYAVCFVGRAEINGKPVYDILKSLQEKADFPVSTTEQITEYFKNGVFEELKEKFKKYTPDEDVLIETHFLFCGFENDDVQRPIVYQANISAKKIKNEEVEFGNGIVRKNGNNIFGVYAVGKDSAIEKSLSDKNPYSDNFSTKALNEVVDHARGFVDIMCNSDDDCEIPIKSAVLTPESFDEHDKDPKF